MFKYYKNDKEFEQDKAIEEMAEYIFGNAITHDTQFKEDCRSIARDLICVGYQRISENEVVLAREDYDYLINDCQRWEKLAVEKVDEINKIEKETAEKFAEKFKQRMKEEYQGTGLWWTEIVLTAIEICEEIKQNAKGENQ